MIVASRSLSDGEATLVVNVHQPVQEGNLWLTTVDFSGSQTESVSAKGTDSVDSLLNALSLIRQRLNTMEGKFARFPDDSEPWHYFPVIPPSLGSRFDHVIQQAIEAEHEKFCRSEP